MKNIFSVFLLLFIINNVGSQNFDSYTELASINFNGDNSALTKNASGTVRLITHDFEENLLITGYTDTPVNVSQNSNNTTLIENFFLSKYNTNLELEWNLNLANGHKIIDMAVLPNGDIITVGSIQTRNALNFWSPTKTLYVQKISKNGVSLWKKNFPTGSSRNSISVAIDKTTSEAYITGVFFDSITTDDGFQTSSPTLHNENNSCGIFLLKLDELGNTLLLETVVKSPTRHLSIGNLLSDNTLHASNLLNYHNGSLYFSFYPSGYNIIETNTDSSPIEVLDNASNNTYVTKTLDNIDNSPYLAQINSDGKFVNYHYIHATNRNYRSPIFTHLTENESLIISPINMGLSISTSSPAFNFCFDFNNPQNSAATIPFLQGSSTPLSLIYYKDSYTFEKLLSIDGAKKGNRRIQGLTSNTTNEVFASGTVLPSFGASSVSVDLDPAQNKTFSPSSSNHYYFTTIYNPDGNLIWGKFYENPHCITGYKDYLYSVEMRGGINITVYKKTGALSVDQYNSDKNKIVAYPNPTKEILNITNIEKPFNYKIFDTRGRLIQQEDNYNKNSIYLNKLMYKGFYILQVSDLKGKLELNTKFLKE